MTPFQIQQVESSFATVAPVSDSAAETFYSRLFEIDPSLQPLFKGDMKAQGRKLMQMISTAVNGLGKLETIVPAVQALGARHAAYGVAERDYDTVGQALLWTLEQRLGTGFTPEVRDSWAAAYGLLADTMKSAARSGNAPPERSAARESG
jgi:hemoglobin-like flavoprotein